MNCMPEFRYFIRTIYWPLIAAICFASAEISADNRNAKGASDSLRIHRSTRQQDATDLSQLHDSYRINREAIDNYSSGLILEELGNIGGAVEHYLAALAVYPDSYEIRLSLGGAFFKARRYVETLDALIPAERKGAEGFALMAAACRGLGLDDSACMFYLKVLALEPNNSMAYSYLAGYYRLAGNVDSTIWAYENLARMQPDNYRILQEIAKLYAQTDRKDSAKIALMKSLTVQNDATNMLAYLGLAQLYVEESKFDSARDILSAGLSREPQNLMVLRELLSVSVQLDSLEQALGYAKEISRLTPLDFQAKRRESILYFGCDSLKQADSVLSVIIDRGEGTSSDHHYRGRIALARRDLDHAEKHFMTVTRLADSLPQSWLDLAFVYRSKKESDKEISTIQTGINHMRTDSLSIRLLFALGAAYDQSGNVDMAVTTLEEIIAKHPSHDQALNYLGYLFADRGERLDYAQQLIERALQISPENAAYVDSYGWVMYRKGDFKQAITQLKRAVDLADDPTIFDHLGDAYQALGDTSEARRWWQKALEMTPDNSAIKGKMSR
jgi:tetratricopeptide (TPR) repeat protein